MSPNIKRFLCKKFPGAKNYKQQSCDMIFVLQNAKLWDHIDGLVRNPPKLKKTPDNNKDINERIYQR